MTTTCPPPLRGWGPDPGGRHDFRWYVHGRPTSLVRDGDLSRYDPLVVRDAPVQAAAPTEMDSAPAADEDRAGPNPDPLATWFSSDGATRDFWTRPGRRTGAGEDGRRRYLVAVRRRR